MIESQGLVSDTLQEPTPPPAWGHNPQASKLHGGAARPAGPAPPACWWQQQQAGTVSS